MAWSKSFETLKWEVYSISLPTYLLVDMMLIHITFYSIQKLKCKLKNEIS